MDSVIHLLNNWGLQINHYPVDKYYKNQLCCPLSKDKYPTDSVIHLSHMQLGPHEYSVVDWIDIYAVDGIIHCSNNYRDPGHK